MQTQRGILHPNSMAMDLRAQNAGHKLGLGIAIITAAFFCSASMSALSKEAAAVPSVIILFLQYAISFIVFVPFAIRNGPRTLRTEHFFLQLFRSLCGAVCQLLFFISVRSIPLLDAVLLSNSAPLFIPVVVFLWFRRPIQPAVWASLFIGLVGVALIIKPGPQLLKDPASLIALAAGLLSALALVATNKLAETEPPVRILIYNFGLATTLLIPVSLPVWKALTLHQWIILLGIGLLYAVTQYLIILAYRYASASELSPFNYTVVIFSGLLGWMLFGNTPDRYAILGTALICAGGILSISAGHPEGKGHAFGFGHWKLHWKTAQAAQTSS